MVAVLARLKWTLLVRALRTSVWRTAGVVLGALGGLVVAIGWVVTMLLIGADDAGQTQAAVVLSLAGVVAAWVVMPLLVFGIDETLDPVRFALLPLSAERLRPGLLVAGFIGVPGVLTAVLSLTPLLAWVQHGVAAALAALVSGVLFTLTCFLGARALTSGFAGALASRRYKDFAAVLLAAVVMCVGIGVNVLSSRAAESPEQARQVITTGANVLGWTPLGWAAAFPGDVARGDWLVAALRLALAVGLVAVLWAVWGRFLQRGLTSISESDTSGPGEASDLPERVFGTSPTGAVAARCARYWRRDPRYLASVVSFVVLPIMIGVSTSVGGGGGDAFFVGPLILAALTGPGLTSDLAYDSSALWTHVVTGVPGRADRVGRALAMGVVIVPLVMITAVVALAVTGRWEWAPGYLAALVCLVLVGMGVGLVTGSVQPGQAPPPGSSPFATGGSGGLLTVAIFAGGVVAAGLLSLPVLVPLAVWGLDSLPVQLLLLVVAVAWGGLLFRLAATWSGHRLERHWPELLARVSN